MLTERPIPEADPLREAMRRDWLADDEAVLRPLLPLADIGPERRTEAQVLARSLVGRLREAQQGKGGVDALLNEFSLSTEEGVVLMCLAEALLRVPDAHTADALIRDKLQGGNWSSHLGQSESIFVNASAWALLFTGKMVSYSDAQQRAMHGTLKRAAGRLGQPVIRRAVRRAMAIMGDVFVMGRHIEAAMQRASRQEARGYRYSYDMLGEGARTAAAAQDYFEAYLGAIEGIGRRQAGRGPEAAAGISVKLSALHPRYEYAQRDRVLAELVPRLKQLALRARDHDIGLTVDAEEAARLDLSLDVIEAVFRDPALKGWSGFGLAVQAYQKRAPLLIDWLAELARRVGRRLMVRLVKGAYWDTEIKLAQQEGLAGYPVFSRKPGTDLCYQACARKLLAHRRYLYPQFATHNAWTVAAILAMDEDRRGGFEFQRLHGMGEALYDEVMRSHGISCRIYAPVGEHEDLLAYLVRRLLENGANSSFVNNIVDPHVSLDSLIRDPVQIVQEWDSWRHPAIPLPRALYGPGRVNSAGLDLSDIAALRRLRQGLLSHWPPKPGEGEPVRNPAMSGEQLGAWWPDRPEQMLAKLAAADRAWRMPDNWEAAQRAEFLQRLGEVLEAARDELVLLCVKEAGKTLADAVAEIREAVDFCHYYAEQARRLPSGEPLGVVLCISPWNFPLAIFLGQICGALAAGNAVLAKPAEQTSLIAQRALALMQQAGLPEDLVQLICGPGPLAGQTLVPDSRIRGVLFTGSTATGRWLFEALSARPDAPVPLIAETGGQNAMIVDSTALPEQVVDDVIRSGFHSAGQRCSALRVLYLQEDIADALIGMIRGAMDELRLGDPAQLSTDIGPVIDAAALARLEEHRRRMERLDGVRLLHSLERPAGSENGHFFGPRLYEIAALEQLDGEVFGPVVHVIRYRAVDLPRVMEDINAAGYGLTLGVHSRVQRTAERIAAQAAVGNVYVNRDMIGAVVGVQPFGGRGLSGTGPKAGGPLYLTRLQHAGPTAEIGPIDLSPRLLPGPTGERNLYLLEPRGEVLALYGPEDDIAHCRATLDAALGTGNVLCLQVPPAWLTELENRRRYLIAKGLPEDRLRLVGASGGRLENAPGCLVLAPGSALRSRVLAALAGQEGPLPTLICEPVSQDYWTRFVQEKVVTTDTTAAGGNASLMTMRP